MRNPLIEQLKSHTEEGDHSTVPTNLLKRTIEALQHADDVVEKTERLLDKLEDRKDAFQS